MVDNLTLDDIRFKTYENEEELRALIKLVENDLSEPYSIFTYRYFLQKWPNLCFLAYHGDKMIGVILGKLEARGMHRAERGYIAMLVVTTQYRKLKIGSKLVNMFIEGCRSAGGDEVVLETEVVNIPALRLYESLGFARDKRLENYYMNGNAAYRLKLWIKLDKLVPRLFEDKNKPKEASE